MSNANFSRPQCHANAGRTVRNIIAQMRMKLVTTKMLEFILGNVIVFVISFPSFDSNNEESVLVEGENAICIRYLNRACFHFRLITDSIIDCTIPPIIYQIKLNQFLPLNLCYLL